ncbi:MAG: glycosyltransferase, partial [Pseudolactococcus laudensis]
MYKNWLTEDIESMASSINYSEILEIAKKIDLKNAFKENYETLSKREYFEKLNLRYQDFIANSTIGIAMLVKNQENRIYPAISNLLDLCDEFVVVDTGSTDKTVEQINKIESDKLQLFSKEWVEDFSLMRNFASSKVTTDWIFFVDSDEVLFETIDKNILRNIAALLASLSNESIAIQFKIKRPNQNSFTLAERGLRKGTTHYVNK